LRFGSCSGIVPRAVRPAGRISRIASAFFVAATLALAVAVAFGAVAVPNLAASLSDAIESLGWWVFVAVPGLVFLETSAFVGFAIHGELALLAGGVAAAELGDGSLALMLALVWAAAVGGDVTSLRIGRLLGRPFIERHGARVRFGPAQLARVDGFFARHGGKALFLGRFTGFLRATMPFVAGASGVSVRRLVVFSAASALLWTGTFVGIGYAYSESFAGAGETATRVALALLLLTAAGFVLRAQWARRARPRAAPPGA